MNNSEFIEDHSGVVDARLGAAEGHPGVVDVYLVVICAYGALEC